MEIFSDRILTHLYTSSARSNTGRKCCSKQEFFDKCRLVEYYKQYTNGGSSAHYYGIKCTDRNIVN
jgi:hypothetical protein